MELLKRPSPFEKAGTWLSISGIALALGAIPSGIGVAQVAPAWSALMSNNLFVSGLVIDLTGILAFLWSLVLLEAHRYAGTHWCPNPAAHNSSAINGKSQQLVRDLLKLRSLGDVIRKRSPTLESEETPADLDETLRRWKEEVLEVLGGEPALRAQFAAVTSTNAALALMKAHPAAIWLQNRLSVLDAIIKHAERGA